MLEKLNGEGQGVCMICNIEKGFHRYWTTSLYNVRNSKGLLLRFEVDSVFSHTVFSDDVSKRPVCLCYQHALDVEYSRKLGTDF